MNGKDTNEQKIIGFNFFYQQEEILKAVFQRAATHNG